MKPQRKAKAWNTPPVAKHNDHAVWACCKAWGCPTAATDKRKAGI